MVLHIVRGVVNTNIRPNWQYGQIIIQLFYWPVLGANSICWRIGVFSSVIMTKHDRQGRLDACI